jgi:hypothetical protein
MKRKEFAWVTPLAYLGLLAGLLPCLIVALILQKKATLTFGMCAKHRQQRLIRICSAWGAVLLGVVMIVMAIGMESGVIAILGIVLILGSGFFAAIAVPVLKPKKIDAGIGTYGGCSSEFLATLPNSQMARRWV